MNSRPTYRLMILIPFVFLVSGPAVAGPPPAVFVPGNASGGFGYPAEGYVPLVPALEVFEKGTIRIIYISGTVTDSGGVNAGPNGVPWPWSDDLQFPLQEAAGTMGGTVPNLNALIGVFVPRSTVETPGFAPVDGTKALAPVGIPPHTLFFVGRYATIEVPGAGILFLGINDMAVQDNGGGFAVRVLGP